MQDHPVLGQLALGYSPIIDRQRRVVATRLTVFAPPGSAAPDAVALLYALAEVWPGVAGGEPTRTPGTRQAATTRPPAATAPLSLNLADEALLCAVLAQDLGTALMVEVPAFMAGDPVHAQALQRLHAAGTPLLIKGRPLAPLAPAVLACFGHALVVAGEERRGAGGPDAGARRVATLQADVSTSAAAEAAFQRGVTAVVGWPFEDPLPAASARSQRSGETQAVLQLIQGVDRDEPVGRLEAVLKRDPALAFKLMRLLNSPVFGLTVEINSLSQALMLLGTQRLKRWLALLLANSGASPNARPLVFAAVRRGLLMEELVRGQGDAAMGGEMFICGLFSLLDRLLEQPLPALLANVPVPEPVQQALRGQGGPYLPYLQLVQAIEQASLVDIREGAERLLLGAAEVNGAVLAALQAARHLDG